MSLQDALGRQAKILIAHHQFEAGMPILTEREQLYRAVEDRFGLSDTLCDQVPVLQSRGEWANASELAFIAFAIGIPEFMK